MLLHAQNALVDHLLTFQITGDNGGEACFLS